MNEAPAERDPESEESRDAADVEVGDDLDGMTPRPGDLAPGDGAVGDAGPTVSGLERLDQRVVVYWLLTSVLGWLVLNGFVALVAVVFWADLPGTSTLRITLWASVAGVMLLWGLIAPPLAYARWRFSIDEELLTARYGIIFHEEKAIPINRLQHVDLTRGPVERLFGLATLVVFTAGTEGASFRLPGLAAARAREMRDVILAARGDDVI